MVCEVTEGRAIEAKIMSFRLTFVDLSGHPSQRATQTTRAAHLPVLAAGVLAAAFCAFDLSPYGSGYVFVVLGAAETWLDASIGSFRAGR